MRESYKRFVKTWIRFANPWIRFVLQSRILTPKRFVSGSTKRILHEDSFCFDSLPKFSNTRIVDLFRRQFLTRFGLFSRIQRIQQIQQILTNLYYIDVLRIHTNPGVRIREYLRCSKDSFCGFVSSYGVQKIRFVDSFRTTVFKRFVSWIRFVRPKISKDSIRFVLEGFVYKSRILIIQ